MTENDFYKINEEIEKIKSVNFFDNINAEIKITNKLQKQKTTICFGNNSDLFIEIVFLKSDRIIFNHYLKNAFADEFWPQWQKEIKKRGLEFNSIDIKKEVINDYLDLQFPNLKTFEIIPVVKGLFVMQILLKYVLENAKLPKAVWNEKDVDHKRWEKYFKVKPMTGGILDGLIDEIDSIPEAFNYIYQLMTVENLEENEFAKLHSIIDDKKLVELYIKNEGLNRIESKHKAAQTYISVGRLLTINEPKK